MANEALGAWDYVVFGTLVSATFSIGIYYAVVLRKRGHVSEYLFAERSMSFLPLTLSIQASFESTVTMLGMPAEGYGYGISFVYIEIGYTLARVVEQWTLLSFIRTLDLGSPFEYLDLRFKSAALRRTITAISCVENLLYISIVSYGQAIAIKAVTGFSEIGSIISIGIGTLIYTSIGGLRAVIWTDVLQMIFMFTGIFLVLIKSTVDSGGFDETMRRNTLSGRFDLNLSSDITVRHTLWNTLFGGLFYGFGFLFRPAVFQRLRAAKTLLDARRAILIAILIFPVVSYLCVFQGLVAYSYFYSERCDPFASKQVDSFTQIITFLTLKLFSGHPGLTGLFLAGIFSASIRFMFAFFVSTISSCLSALATMTFQDFVKPVFPNLSEFRGVLVSKLTVVICGIVSSCIAVWISTMEATTLIQLFISLVHGLRAPTTGLFWMGLLFPFVNKKGAVMGILAAVCLYSWILIGSRISPGVRQPQHLELAPTDQCVNSANSTFQYFNISNTVIEPEVYTQTRSNMETFYSISYTLYGAMGILTTVIVGVLSSLATGKGNVATDPKYVIPAARKRGMRREQMILISSRTKSETDEGSNMDIEDNTLL